MQRRLAIGLISGRLHVGSIDVCGGYGLSVFIGYDVSQT